MYRSRWSELWHVGARASALAMLTPWMQIVPYLHPCVFARTHANAYILQVTTGAVAETQFDDSLLDEVTLSPKDYGESACEATDLLHGETTINQACHNRHKGLDQESHGSTEGPRTTKSDEPSETVEPVRLPRLSVSLQPAAAAETSATTPAAEPRTPNDAAKCDPSAPSKRCTPTSAVKQSQHPEGQDTTAKCSAALLVPSNDPLSTTRLPSPVHSDMSSSLSLGPTATPTLRALQHLSCDVQSSETQTRDMEAAGNATHVAADTEDERLVHRKNVGRHASSTMRMTDTIPSSPNSEAHRIQRTPGSQPSSPTPPLLPLPRDQHNPSPGQPCQFLEPTGALIGHSGVAPLCLHPPYA